MQLQLLVKRYVLPFQQFDLFFPFFNHEFFFLVHVLQLDQFLHKAILLWLLEVDLAWLFEGYFWELFKAFIEVNCYSK